MATSPNIGTELAGYRLEALLGRGGMGVVYRAHDLALDRDVALKLLAPHLADDVSFRERFLRESRLAASLEHPNVVPIHDAGEIDGQLYIAMRLVDGTDLNSCCARGRSSRPGRSTSSSRSPAPSMPPTPAGSSTATSNPRTSCSTSASTPTWPTSASVRYLGEAGAALGAENSLGTIDYVAPEQIRGEEIDGRADVYALGCLLYECLAGKPPFRRASDAATLFAHLEDEPPSLPTLDRVLPRALAKEPSGRYQTCAELVGAAREALGIAEPRRSRWPVAFAAVGLAVIGAALLAFFLTRGDGAGAGGPGRAPPAHRPVLEPRHRLVPRGRRPAGGVRRQRPCLGGLVPRQHALAARSEVGRRPDQVRRRRATLCGGDRRRRRLRRRVRAGPVHRQRLEVRRGDRRPCGRKGDDRLQPGERHLRRLGRRLPQRPEADPGRQPAVQRDRGHPVRRAGERREPARIAGRRWPRAKERCG